MKFYLTALFIIYLQYTYGQRNFSVRIEPRMEAVSIFYTLATSDTLDIKPSPSTYYRDFKKYFKECKNHMSMEWYRKLDKWDGYDIASLGLFLTHGYPFSLEMKPHNDYIRSAPVDTFLFYFNKFYKDCDVKKFITEHQADDSLICKNAEDTIAKSKILNYVKSFFGAAQEGSFIIYLDLLNNIGNNAIPISGTKDRISRLAYLSDSSQHLTDDSPVVFIPHLNVISHECSHIYLNDFIPKYKERLYKIRNHFLKTTSGKILNENEWENELDELLVRVCVAKIMEIKFGQMAGMEEINNQSIHFRWAKPLYAFLGNYYCNDRKKYETFSDFYPELLNFLETKTSL